jgi:hypothetical protein
MAIDFLVLFILVALTVIALGHQYGIAIKGHRLLAILSLSPYLLHTWYAWEQASGFGPPAQPPTGVYPGLVAFAESSLFAQCGMSALTLTLARRYLLGLTFVPLITGLFY